MTTRLLSPTDLAALLGLAPQTIYNRLSDGGDLPVVTRIGRLPRFMEADVEAWLATKREPEPAAPLRRPGRPTKAEQIARRRRGTRH